MRRSRTRFERWITPFMVKASEIEQSFRQLAVLLKGDVAVVEAFETAGGLAKGLLGDVWREVAQDVRAGASLAKALRRHAPFIGAIHLGLIEVGELNGMLPKMMDYSVEMMIQKRRIRSKVIQAMTYPAVVVLMGAGVGYYVTVVAIPKIIDVMGSDPRVLPPITKSLLTVSAGVRANGVWILAAPFIVLLALKLLRLSPPLRTALDFIGARLPLFGKVSVFAQNALLNRTLALLVASGVTVVEALDLVRRTLSNAFYRREVARVRTLVLAGKPLARGVELTAVSRLSPLTRALARVGESSGRLDEGLLYAGDYYEDALERRLDFLSKLVEPALIVVVGGMVAYVYIAFFMGMAAMSAAAR